MCVYCDLEHSMIDFLRRTERVVVPSYRVKVKRWRGRDRSSLSFLDRFHDRRSRAQLKAFCSYLAGPEKLENTLNREFRKLNENLETGWLRLFVTSCKRYYEGCQVFTKVKRSRTIRGTERKNQLALLAGRERKCGKRETYVIVLLLRLNLTAKSRTNDA
jgi:hypothetical protein